MEARRSARARRVSLLGDILAHKRTEVDALRDRAEVRGPTRTPIDAAKALRRGRGEPLRLVAEVKLRSPSAGALSRALTPGQRALAYAEGGAAMVSVLCDAPYFDGSWEHLKEARQRLDETGRAIPLLAKEFVIDERQIAEARYCGADAILLIARIVDASKLRRLTRAARAEGLEPLVEVVDERELETALEGEARVVGVNARDLDSLAMDGARAARLCAAIPPEVVAVYLSGVRQADDVAQIARTRTDAALIGEVLMRDDDPRPRLLTLVDAARGK
jgi:indole-3-glycerol phosphate synthase